MCEVPEDGITTNLGLVCFLLSGAQNILTFQNRKNKHFKAGASSACLEEEGEDSGVRLSKVTPDFPSLIQNKFRNEKLNISLSVNH